MKKRAMSLFLALTMVFLFIFAGIFAEGEAVSPQAPAITAHPKDRTVSAGQKATFSVTATGENLAYQWYYLIPGETAWKEASSTSGKKPSYTVTAQAKHNGYQYKAVVTNGSGEATSKTATLTVTNGPMITTHPKDRTVSTGQTATFSVTATGDNLTYQWYYLVPGTTAWKEVSSASGKKQNYTLTAQAKHDGYRYKAAVKNGGGEATSEIATLTVKQAPKITGHPKDKTVSVGKKVTFSVNATGENLTYQWYYRIPGTTAWKTVSSTSGKKPDYTLTAQAKHNGYQYKVTVKNEDGEATSEIASLTVKQAPEITGHPKDQKVSAGQKVTFSVTATGEGLNYQWYYLTPGTTTWKPVSSASGKKKDYTLTALARHNGYQYKVTVKNEDGEATSEIASLTIKQPPEITGHPKDQAVSAGKKATFSVTTTGEGLNYQWYYLAPGTTAWKPVSSASGKEKDYTLTALARHNGYQYKATVKNGNGEATSETATLTVISGPMITEQPQDITVSPGQKVTFSITVTGENPTYQWYYLAPGATAWKPVSSASGKEKDYTLTALARHNGYQYKATVKNGDSESTSEIATLTVINGPMITEQPKDMTVAPGQKATFSVAAKGEGLKYQWYYLIPGATDWKEVVSKSGKLQDFSLTALERHNGYQYKVVVTDENGEATSENATLTVSDAPIITEHPQDQTVTDGQTATFNVTATGENLTFQWYYLIPESTTWKKVASESGKLPEFTLKALARHNGYQYRAVVANEDGETTSEIATLTVFELIVVDEVTYEPLTSTTCRVLSYSGSAKTLVIPTEVEGMTVVEIAPDAFCRKTSLVSVDLPNTITVIGARAFKDCTNLSKMTTH